MTEYQGKHIEDVMATMEMMGQLADSLSRPPYLHSSKARHVGLVLRAARLAVLEYAQGIVDGLDPYDALTLAVDIVTAEDRPWSLERLQLRD